MYEKDVKDPCTLSNEMLLRAVARNPPITEGHPTLAWNEDRPGSTDHQVALWAWLSLPEPPRQGCGGGGAVVGSCYKSLGFGALWGGESESLAQSGLLWALCNISWRVRRGL